MVEKNRLIELDIFRGIAILIVLLFHYTTRFEKLFFEYVPTNDLFKYGYLGVEFFFIISGFVIFISLKRTKNISLFFTKRFLRLYPVYWICLIITFIITNTFGLTGRETSLNELFVNLTMLQHGFSVKSVDGVYWSLFYEIFFYISFSTIYYLNNKRSDLIFFILTFLCLLFDDLNLYKLGEIKVDLISSMFLFFNGIQFYRIKFKDYSCNRFLTYIMIVVSFFSFIYFSNISKIESIYILTFHFMFFIISINKSIRLRLSFLEFIGKISYPLYLLHQNIGYVLLIIFSSYLNGWFLFIFVTSIILYSSYLSHIFLEKKFTNYLRKIIYKIVN